MRYERYVALGDSSTEGIADGDPRRGWHGWSRRLAARVASAQDGLEYANLAVRGLTTREVVDHQLARALALRPGLASAFTGTNDVLARRFDVRTFASDTLRLQSELRASGATVVTFTLPDLTPLLPLAAAIAPRIHAMNEALRTTCAATGTVLVDFAAHPVATDARLWHPDRLHANPAGHARIADALAEALGLPGADATWRDPLPIAPPPGPMAVAMREVHWVARFLLPWALLGLVAPLRPRRIGPGPQPDLRAVEPR